MYHNTDMMNSTMILAGGLGTRFAEYTDKIPKPMIEANGKPLLDHIIGIYEKFQINNFIVLAGYKIEKILEHYSDNATVASKHEFIFRNKQGSTITVLDTGLNTMTGGRVKKGIEYLDEDDYYLTYGDGLADIDIGKLTKFYLKNKTLASVTAVRPPARFGSLNLKKNLVTNFGEKDNTNEGWINGGFFVLNKEVKNYISDTNTVFEKDPLENLSLEGNLSAYKHEGFWQPCDTIRELEVLEKALNKGVI